MMQRLLLWTRANAEGVAFAFAFVALATGLGLAWAPLGLIVPGALVAGCLAWKHLRGG